MNLKLALVLVPCCWSTICVAEPYEFLFTANKAISLANGSSIAPASKFDEKALRAMLPGYEFERGEEEGEKVWYVYARKNGEGAGQGGISIYLDSENDSISASIAGGEGVIDSVGATKGMPLTEVYRARRVKCDAGLDYTCASEFSQNAYYVVDGDSCGPGVAFPSYYDKHKLTTLDPCMKVWSIFLSRPGH